MGSDGYDGKDRLEVSTHSFSVGEAHLSGTVAA